MAAWNKLDEFEPDEKANYYEENVGYSPHFYHKNGILSSLGKAHHASYTGIIHGSTFNTNCPTSAPLGLRLPLKTQERAISFGETFLDIFNELI